MVVTTWTSMRVKARYAVGNTSSTLHKIDQGSGRNKIEWHASRRRRDDWLSTTLIVKLQCKRPSILRDPILMNEINLKPTQGFCKMMGHPHLFVMCWWCFTDEERGR